MFTPYGLTAEESAPIVQALTARPHVALLAVAVFAIARAIS
jgi:hypothetical protein